ncbi:hypothetical protein DFP86_10795 [Paludibacterium purpuratum]|uniref:BNR/Asp-box repeat protein n=2 Tax=Paludibacterium purpuratum TaxID=1144873 RepID=A0A4R7B562_9NEIS|nr:hypothetical protein DFP86_10795 [Paludibacterium purpuratum]
MPRFQNVSHQSCTIYRKISFHVFFAAFWMILLSGCAATTAIDPTNAAVPAGHGLLVARILTNNPVVPIDFSHSTLSLKESQTGEKFEMSSKTTAGDAEALFFAALPSGHYQLTHLVAPQGGNTITAPLDELTKGFDITAGHVTDIGALVMAFDSVGPRSGSYRISVISNENDTKVILKMIPSNVLTNLSDTHPEQRDISLDPVSNQHELSLAKRRSAVIVQSQPVEGQTVAFGRALGIVSLWSPDTQQWKTLDTGSSFNVRSVSLLRDGTLLVGCEHGLVFNVGKNGEVRPITPPAEGTVLFAGQGKDDEYLVVLRNKQVITISGSRGLAPANWHELKRFELEYGNSLHSSVQTGIANDRLVLIVGALGFTASTTIHSMELGSHTWVDNPTDLTSLVVPTFSILGDGTLLTSSGTAFTRKLHRSADFGKSWKSTPIENWMTTVIPRNLQTIYVPRIDHIGLFEKDSTVSLMKSDDGGNSWSPQGELPKFMTDLYVLPRMGWLAVKTQVGDLYLSSDDGKTWRFSPMR